MWTSSPEEGADLWFLEKPIMHIFSKGSEIINLHNLVILIINIHNILMIFVISMPSHFSEIIFVTEFF